jgi:hypothetical protein
MKSNHWEGVEANPNEHRTTGGRAWCYQDACGTWCYPTSHCNCCLVMEGYELLIVKRCEHDKIDQHFLGYEDFHDSKGHVIEIHCEGADIKEG